MVFQEAVRISNGVFNPKMVSELFGIKKKFRAEIKYNKKKIKENGSYLLVPIPTALKIKIKW